MRIKRKLLGKSLPMWLAVLVVGLLVVVGLKLWLGVDMAEMVSAIVAALVLLVIALPIGRLFRR